MGRPAYKPEDVWRFIEKRGEDECWPWLGTCSAHGYGVMNMNGEQYRVARIVCWLRDPVSISLRETETGASRKIPLHSCDNPPCCNPNHLSVGTPKENTQDMIAKGRRHNFDGERGQRAKLTNADVERIREARLFGAVQKDTSSVYGVSVPTVSMIINRQIYKDAP